MKTVDYPEILIPVNASPWEKLAYATILQAIEDYKELKIVKKGSKKYEYALIEMENIKKFFRSDRFQIFNPSDVDGESLIEYLDATCE